MQVQFTITLDDILAFNRYCVQHLPTYKRTYRTLLISVPVIFVLIALALSINTYRPPWLAWIIAFVAVVAWPFIWPRRYQKTMDEFVMKTMQTGQNRSMLGVHTVTLSEQGLRATSEVSESSITWSGIERIEQDDQYIYLFVAATAAHIVPKRALVTMEQASDFYHTAQTFFDQARA
jgi:hypothetical protein